MIHDLQNFTREGTQSFWWHVTHEDSRGQHEPRDGSGKPDAPSGRVMGAPTTYANPNNVEVPAASAPQTEFRSSISPRENKGQIDSCGDKEEK